MGVISVSLEDSANGNVALKTQARASIGKVHRASLKGREEPSEAQLHEGASKAGRRYIRLCGKGCYGPAKAGIRILPSALPPHGDTGAGLLAVTAQQHSTPKP